MPTEDRRIRCRIRGRVQGVWFRAGTQREARALGLAGWVRNLADGGVELVAEGSSGDVERLLRWLHEGPRRAEVDAVDVAEEAASGRGVGFEILY